MNGGPESKVQGLVMAPKTVPLGTSVLLMNIDDALKYFPNRTHNQLLKIFRLLNIPLIRDKKQSFFNVYTLEKVLNYITRAGGRGFALPGSAYRNNFKRRDQFRDEPGVPIMAITDKELKEMNSALLEAERLSTGPKGKMILGRSYIEVLRAMEKDSKKKGKTATS